MAVRATFGSGLGSRFRPASSTSGRRIRMRHRQGGQALIYGLFVMTGGLAALFFLFNTGQLSSEKSRLVNTADAVAYSAGVVHARTLNFMAYTNRAMLANTVAIAQLVSLSSWRQYADSTAQMGGDLGKPYKYPSYFSSYMALQQRSGQTGDGQDELQSLAEDADAQIRDLLRQGQETASRGLAQLRQQVMDDVARANYRDGQDGVVIAEPLHGETDPYHSFVHRYSGGDRGRFADLATTAAKSDPFQDKRSWRLEALVPDCTGSPWMDWIERRGGTELVGLDEWKAIDTISEFVYYRPSKYDPCIGLREDIAGAGGQSAADNAGIDADPRHYDQSAIFNPSSTALAMMQATSSSWDYSGIPEFHELSESWLKADDPALLFAVRLRRSIAQTRTSEGHSDIGVTPRLNNYRAQAAGDELVAVSTSKVYFRRPAQACDGSSGSRRNCRGGQDELGSLFNPYWQVGLVQDNSPAVARGMQGVPLP